MRNVHPDQSRFISYLDGTLSDADRRELQAHIAECNDCAGLFSSWERLADAIRSLPDPAFEQALRAKLHDDTGRSQSGPGVVP